jgi:hypothetical protein
MARTAAVVGTATATRNVVNRRQAEKNVQAQASAINQAYPQQPQPQYVMQSSGAQPSYIVQAPPMEEPVMMEAPVQEDVITQLERLGALKAQGLLTEEEFAAQKAKLLGM